MRPERWHLIEQLYHAALERAANQRAAFLEEACAGDAKLRTEIEMLIAANEHVGGFLAAPALELEAKNMASEDSASAPRVTAGQSLSHYTIVSLIGAGGMGEVFLARDTVLERRVALKLLPLEFTQNTERLHRFMREAKSASGLNHPNIITIYEIGEVATEAGTTHFIATEFIEGETLRTWTADPEKRIGQILNIGVQVSSALDAAHKAGIVHRDIKPENVMVRPDGLAKVLDFGLAKLTAQTTDSSDTSVPTLVDGMKTRPGMILGTLRYMSPEQARGRSVDSRSDIFSLGVVLYELLTGEPLFAGESDADVIAAIIYKEAPPLARYMSEIPPELDRIVQKALAKDTEQRYRKARDFQIDLQSLMQDAELSARLTRSRSAPTGGLIAQTSSRLAAPRFSIRQLLLGSAISLLVVGAIWWLATRRNGSVETPPIASLKTTDVVAWRSTPGEVYSVGAFSPDGKWVAFTSTQSGSNSIWVKQSTSGDAEPSTKDEFENDSPIWSPDGDELAFTSTRNQARGIWRKPPFGGTPTLLKTLAEGEGSVRLRYWSKKSATIYYESQQNLFALEVQSRQTRQVTNFDATKVQFNTISISPDEKHICFVPTSDDGRARIWIESVRDHASKQIAGPFDEVRNTVWHPDGNRILFSSKVNGTFQIIVADRAGHRPAQLTFGEKDVFVLDVSADGTRILYGSSKEESDVWGVNLVKADEFAVAGDISAELWPDVSADNQTVAYQSVANLSYGDKLVYSSILTKQIGAKAKPFYLVKEGFVPTWSPDGTRLAFLRFLNDTVGLWTVNAGGGEEKQLANDGVASVEYSALPYLRWQARNFNWSPDGQRIAYVANRNGQRNVWTVASDGSTDTQTTSNTDSNLFLYCPMWSADGKRIVYSSRTNTVAEGEKTATYCIWMVDVEGGSSRIIFQANSYLRLIGWSQADQELILVAFDKRDQSDSSQTRDVILLRVSTLSGEKRQIATLPSTYFYNVYLSGDRRTIAFTAHQDGRDDVWIVPAAGGDARKVTANNDPRLFFSSLAWSPDGKAIYFGKQTQYTQLAMIANFE